MAIPTTTTSSGSGPGPARRDWTREEFQRASDLGLFGPEERLELIEGDIYKKVTQNSPHATTVTLAQEALREAFGSHYHVRNQLPLALGERSQPEPDIAVVAGSVRDYARAHPTTAVLVVEVSDTTLAFDRTTKAGLYAQAGIGEYWIVNVLDRVLEVHRQPTAMAAQPLGHHYRSITRHTEGETIIPMAAPDTSIAVADVLP